MSVEDFRAFISKYKVKKGEIFTHTLKAAPCGSFYIDADSADTVLQKYSTVVSNGGVLSLCEKPGVYAPLRIDFDMKSVLEDGMERMYTHEDVKMIIRWIQTLLLSSIDEEVFESKMLVCLLLEKKAPRLENGIVKDGFHLHFPHFICDGWFQDEFVRGYVNERIKSGVVFRNAKYSTPLVDIIDKNIANKVWLMYGSAKFEDGTADPYLLSKSYDGNMNEVTLQEIFSDEMSGRTRAPEFYLPYFLSVRDWVAATQVKESVLAAKNTKAPRKRTKIILRKRDDAAIFEDIKTITDGGIMDMVSPSRADDYDRWIDLGWILYNIGEGCEESLQLWIEFSKKSSKFVVGDCEDQWSKMTLKGKTIASLFAIAKNDSPREYFEWKKTQMNFHLHNALQSDKPNEHDVSMIVHHLYKDRFVCVDSKKDVWYEFRNHKWNLLDDGLSLKKLFCGEIRDYFYAYKEDIVRRQRETTNEVEKARLELQETRCIKMTTALKEVQFHDKVMKMSKLFFYDATFLKLMDENRSLFGCNNGVLDLGMNIFREGRPDDYITLSSNVDYNPNYTNQDEDILAVHDFLNKIFPNKNLKEYFLDSICACLEGGNLNKTFIIHTGEPDGGKSMTMSFVEKAFGDYCIKFPRELFVLSGKTSSGGARPELARVRGKRLGLGQEVTQMETFNIGVVKELTGNDSFFVRNLFEKGTDIKPMFTLMMQCNKPPNVPGNDEGTWARIRLLPYESKFVKAREEEKYPVPETEEERIKLKRWKADPNLQDKLDELTAALLWILFTRYADYKKRGLRDTPEVHSATTHYRQLNDVFMQYTADRIGADQDSFLKLTEVASDFNDWFKENNASYAKEKFTKIAIGTEISKKLGVPLTKKGVSQGWQGFKITIEEFEDPNARVLLNLAQAIKK